MKLINIEKKSIAFQKGQEISFYKGEVTTIQGDDLFQYSISTQKHLGKYRLTLSYPYIDIRHLCVFQIEVQAGQVLSVFAENEIGKEIWENTSHIKHQEISQSIQLITSRHLQET